MISIPEEDCEQAMFHMHIFQNIRNSMSLCGVPLTVEVTVAYMNQLDSVKSEECIFEDAYDCFDLIIECTVFEFKIITSFIIKLQYLSVK